MFNRLIHWSVCNRLLILIALFVIGFSSYIAIPNLNLDAFPDVTNVQVAVNTEAPGLASEEVEQLITFPIESVMYALPDVEEVRSISKTGLSGITIVFKEGTDIYFARQLVFERLQQAKELIPEGVGTPEIGPNTSGLGQVYQYLLVAQPDSGYDAMALRSLNDWVVKLLLMPVDGVTDVLSFGGEVKQYQVNIEPSKLLSYHLSINDVIEKIQNSNRNSGGWYMNRGQEQLVIRGVGWLGSGKKGLKDISNIPVIEQDGVVVRVGDLAKVEFGQEIRQGAVTMTRRTSDNDMETLGEVVSGIVLKRMGSNTKATIDGINERVELIQQALPEGVKFDGFYDQSDLITKAVKTVVDALLMAFIFIIIILALFLVNLRATFLVLISIPLSIGLALMVMSWFGLSANLMSLGGLAVAIGMLVDGSVVMVENIFKHLSHPDRRHDEDVTDHIALNDSDPYDVQHDNHGIGLRIQEAGKEVARPVFFAAMIILVVFSPIFTFEGVEAKLFQPMAISIMLAILAAVIVALLVVPALATYLFRHGVRQRQSPLLMPLEYLYKKSLKAALKRPSLIVILSVVLFAFAASTVPDIGTEFVPELEEGTINLRTTLAPSASLETSISVAKKLEQQLMTFPEVTYALSRIGRAEIGGDPEPVNNIEIYIGLKPIEEWTSASDRIGLQELMEHKLEIHPGLLFNFSQPIATRVDELLSGVKAQLAIKLFGKELSVLAEQGKAIEEQVKQIPGAVDVAMEQIAGEAQLVIRPDRDALSRFGISISEVMSLVEEGVGGISAGQVIQGNERYDIYVRLQEQYRNSSEAIKNLRIQAANGAWVRVSDVARVQIESGPPQIRRDDVQRRVVIQSNVQGRDMGSVVNDIKKAIADNVDLPVGYSVDIGGQYENQQRAQNRLMLVVPISIALIALLLYFAFNSVGQALLIMVNVPLALIGGIFALYLTGQYLSVPSSVGFITLFGVAVLNGVVMVESINQRIEDGYAMQDAVFDGAVSRLRPVLMTALTSALGLIPVLMSKGVGAEIQKPLASVIEGGLISATFLTLFVVPCLFLFFSKAKFAKEDD
ncbi:MAG: CusA/CzcA family heavy metal efflux RND transporter [gamma proteobacterium symbiont of Bathyaustriella thionipta]|nr:CusA/CzcA family heavy metal efflux RND transporter [gamma proteobacterium symbiont of Bathyaustriella thionipta]MCU7949733.1 CusA/CzcA family heavy metal efflux RND transporter [gamma proteobacterium symbiont of Bathyaustriella thionipta]MCU7952855.1 CusA/CzcA family heavy metal efflux RND transporter [gamma proteobacterium symbiont of Bathyaustriella thionipta]MCU7956315.1 CusA/CzcA family heavy metal efflux RND transporter [gamma proteobacterium symbiont of Bathyaustriella thionipta]MCU79